MNVPARWSLGILVGYLTGHTVGHVIAWAGRRIDNHLARVTDLGGDD